MRKIYFVFMILPLLVLTACGFDHKSKDPGPGSLMFSVDWKVAPNLLPAAPGIFQAPLNCAGLVDTVEATLRGSNDNAVNCFNGTCATGPWPCSAHTGTITGIPPQNGIKAGIIAKNSFGDVVFYGEAASPVNVVEGQTTDAGVITALPITTLATTTANPIAVAVDGTNVYWIENGPTSTSGTVKSAPLVPVPGGIPTILATGIGDGRSIAVDPAAVYWSEGSNTGSGTVKKYLKSSGTISVLFSSGQTINNPSSIAIDSTNLYFTANSGSGNGIFRVGLNGGPVTTIASGLVGVVSNIVADGTNVYFAVMGNQTGPIMSVPVTGVNTAPTVLVSNLSSVQAIAIDTTSIYWTDRQITDNTNSVKKALKTGATVTTLTATTFQSFQPAMLVDGTNVYWPGLTNSTVFLNSVGINGGNVRRLAPADIQQGGGNIIPGLAIDSTSIYWPESAGKIKSVARQ